MVPPHGGVFCHAEAHINSPTRPARPNSSRTGRSCCRWTGEGAKLTPEVRSWRRGRDIRVGRPPRPAACAVDHQCDRIWAGLHPRRGRGAERGLRATTGSGCTWTARASPMRWRRSAAIPGEVTWRAGRRRAELRLRQEWRDVGRGAGLLSAPIWSRSPRSAASAPGISTPRAAIRRRRSLALLERGSLAGQCARGQCRRGDAGGGGGGPAALSGTRPMSCSCG